MAYFQVPDGRKLSDSDSGLGDWPQTPAGYRMYLVGTGGDEKIGINTSQTIELQLTGGKGASSRTWRSRMCGPSGRQAFRTRKSAHRPHGLPTPLPRATPTASS